MIEVLPDGRLLRSFEDWSPRMIAIAFKCHRLPSRTKDCVRDPELGIDELNRMPYGEIALELLSEHVEEFEYCPDSEEIIRLGKALIKSHVELQVFRERRRRERAQFKDRANARAEAARPKRIVKLVVPTPRYGFVRGN
jgi:hypothetical protein